LNDSASSSPLLDNATYLWPGEEFRKNASYEEIKKWERLELYNRGTHNRKWTINQSLKHDEDDYYFCQAMATTMGLSDGGRKMMWRLFRPMDMRKYKGMEAGDRSSEMMKQYLVAFCLGAHIYNKLLPEDASDWEYYPGRDCPAKSERYHGPKKRLFIEQERSEARDRHQSIERCAEQLDFSDEQIRSCFEKVRQDISL
jgi:hypothetical protein